jgi:hypothetical protein
MMSLLGISGEPKRAGSRIRLKMIPARVKLKVVFDSLIFILFECSWPL